MTEPALIAAQQWAAVHAGYADDPVQFGMDVARVYLAASAVMLHQIDAPDMAAALADLSVPDEIRQAIARLSSPSALNPERAKKHKKAPADAEGSSQ